MEFSALLHASLKLGNINNWVFTWAFAIEWVDAVNFTTCNRLG